MKRAAIKQLIQWKKSKTRKPLILQGVRQAGKTYLLQNFGENYFPNYHIINFERQTQLCSIFEEDLNPKRILNELQFILNHPIDFHNDLLIFDEIQACPRALTSLKYFCEELPELAICGAGSLLGLHLNETSYPVGKVDMLHLYPMTFSEFLEGIGDIEATKYLSQANNAYPQISEALHLHLWKRLKQYFITGGLPEIVQVFAENQDNLFNATQVVRTKQQELIRAYYADIAKHAGKVNAMHIDRTWRSVPSQLLRSQDSQMKRFKFKGILPNIHRYSQLANVIDWLNSAELIIKTPIVRQIKEPLSAYTKENIFKLFMFDIGILGAMSNLMPKTILDYGYGSYKGFFAENFVAQQLLAIQNQPLYSWQEDGYEIEFLLHDQEAIIPIEVKSGNRIKSTSLAKYVEKYAPTKSILLSANRPIQHSPQKNAQQLPLYLAEFILARQEF